MQKKFNGRKITFQQVGPQQLYIHGQNNEWMASLAHAHEFEETQGDSDGQRSLAYCSSWGLKESDTT